MIQLIMNFSQRFEGLKGHQTRSSIEAYLQQLCVRQLELLESIKMITSDNNSDCSITSTGLCCDDIKQCLKDAICMPAIFGFVTILKKVLKYQNIPLIIVSTSSQSC